MIFILTGPQHSGKTTLLMRTANKLKKKNIQTEGFLSLAVNKGKNASGYDLFDLTEQVSVPFIRRKGEKNWEKTGPFYFIPQGLARAKRLILLSSEDSVLIIDEIGPLELKGRGLWPAVKQVIFSDWRIFLVVVRRSILDDFLKILKGKKVQIFDIEHG
jgi:nucleoside-triphosphatase THEP1